MDKSIAVHDMPDARVQAPRSYAERLVAKVFRWLLALFTVLTGLVLLVGGGWLAWLGGNWMYLVLGLLFVGAGVALAFRRPVGVVLLLIAVILAFIWAFMEADGNRWALIPRLTLPVGFAAVGLLLFPTLTGRVSRPAGWGGAALLVAAALLSPFVLPDNRTDNEALIAQIAARTPSVQTAAVETDVGALPPGEWRAYGGTRGSTRYSPAGEITPNNVAKLERAWVFNTGDLPKDSKRLPGGKKPKHAAETTPLKIGDALYLCTPMGNIIALDPETGAQRWRFDAGVKDDYIPYSATCRGVAYYEKSVKPEEGDFASPVSEVEVDTIEDVVVTESVQQLPAEEKDCAARVIMGTLDARIIAVDAATGRPCEDFGLQGEIRITDGMGEVIPGMVAITSPLTIVNGVIVTNHQVKDNVDIDAPSGVIQGFSAETGELVWAWDMVRPGRKDRPQEPDEYTRGTPNSWTISSADPELGLVYLPMGNSAGDYISYDRHPEELTYATSLVALDAATGDVRWHFQTVHNDVWDYDLGSQASLVDFPTAQGVRKALILPSKQGDLFVLDRETGEPIVEVEERAVPQGGVEPQLRSPTQPFSTWATVAKPPLEGRDMWGMTLLDQLYCRVRFQRASYEGIYTPPTAKQPFIQYPGYNGGSDWGGIAVDEGRGIVVANYNDLPNYNKLLTKDVPIKGGGGGEQGPMAGAVYGIKVGAGFRNKYTQLICKEPPYGGIRGIDLATGETVWDQPIGTARANGPWGIPSKLPFLIGTPNNGGSVLTGSGLTFIGAATDNLFRAYDTASGEVLWDDVLPGGGQSNPMTYEHEGKQYVLIMAGGHHFMRTPVSDAVIAYALPGSVEGSPPDDVRGN